MTFGTTPAQQVADEMNMILTKAARSGQVSPPQLADLLTDALAQTMCFGVEPGRMEEAIANQIIILMAAINVHIQRMAHLRQQPPADAKPGKMN